MAEKRAEERVLQGIGVSPGVAEGPLIAVDLGGLQASVRRVKAKETAEEVARLEAALETARRQLKAARLRGRRRKGPAAEEIGMVLEAHLQMLSSSRLVRGARARIEQDRLNAEAALIREIEALAQGFEAMADGYLAERAEDVREVGRRVLRTLQGGATNPFQTLQEGALAAAGAVSPADVAQMNPQRVAGFAAALGGAQGHTAILARSLGLPAVLGAVGLMEALAEAARDREEAAAKGRDSPGVPAILDGAEGVVVLNPSDETRRRYRERRARLAREARKLERLRDRPAETRDGVRIALQANLDLPMEAAAALENGAEGVGLFRTEFLYMNVDRPPDEEEQTAVLSDVVEAMAGRTVTIRTMDVGGEKLTRALGPDVAGGENPALGLRAIRLSLKAPKLLEVQLAAILRAGARGPVRILLPMITTPGEVRRVREALKKVRRRLTRQGVPQAEDVPPLGVMIETPGAALSADALAQVSDFFAIGTNDLTMYTLAVDRADEQVAALYNPLHPAVLRLIEFSVQAALRARLPVSVCGEVAGDPRFSGLLAGLGVRDLSMSAPAIPRVKQRVLTLDSAACAQRARAIVDSPDSGRIASLLDDLNGLG
ncbi:MAG: phosphoenolpyruvate--protein phosphotransferase [Marivibrio sp.]|uniref:phosphoenolpyruvate--protein phosphotransferase n=1 Tax=Marivibrio sp. TaxID=2039719 RepID=UPI0032EC864A